MLKNGVISSRSPGAKRASTSALVTWSASTTPAASANQRHDLGMAARLARPVEVELATPAQRLGAHVCAVVPAAIALRMRARAHLHGQRPFGAAQRGARSDQHEAQ